MTAAGTEPKWKTLLTAAVERAQTESDLPKQERSRALSNAQIVMPSSVLRGKVQQANPMSSDTFEGIHRRLADVQRNQDNSGFFESPASVVEE